MASSNRQATKEAVRYLRDSQELWENYLTCAARTGKPSDVIYAFHRLLDLRVQHKAKAAAAGGGGKVSMDGWMDGGCVRPTLPSPCLHRVERAWACRRPFSPLSTATDPSTQ